MIDVLQVFGVYSLLVILVGTLGNMLIFMTCMRLKKNTTFIFLRFLSISDTVALYFWNLNHFLVAFFNIDLETLHFMSCKLVMYLQFVSLQISAWILVIFFNLFKCRQWGVCFWIFVSRPPLGELSLHSHWSYKENKWNF